MRIKLCSLMTAEQRKEQSRNVPDSLRTAIERTFAATAEGAAETRGRAGAALDEVARRGREAREVVSGRAQEARESSAGAAARVIEAIEGMRLASHDDLRELSKQVEELSRRIEKLEAKPKVEG
jgi:polyhydroxyalkanoate synthesis regulator phasin